MRILANENFPEDAVTALRRAGHDVAWIRTDAPGSTSEEVLHRAQVESRLLVTFDKAFGELAFRNGLPAAAGVVLFRITARSSAHVARVALVVLGSWTDWEGHFSVVEDRRIRMTPLAGGLDR
jgi:predicted nuclease of predicted toxin-antitoxin system